jgi:predicted Fe-Mo cluster-binding NifX family protein
VKIACVTDDGRTISAHFGRARQYAVLTIEAGRIVAQELRPKTAHEHGAPGEPAHTPGAAGQELHARMTEAIADCEAVLTRGMGFGARQALRRAGIVALITDETDIEAATLAYAAGTLEDHPERLH